MRKILISLYYIPHILELNNCLTLGIFKIRRNCAVPDEIFFFSRKVHLTSRRCNQDIKAFGIGIGWIYGSLVDAHVLHVGRWVRWLNLSDRRIAKGGGLLFYALIFISYSCRFLRSVFFLTQLLFLRCSTTVCLAVSFTRDKSWIIPLGGM